MAQRLIIIIIYEFIKDRQQFNCANITVTYYSDIYCKRMCFTYNCLVTDHTLTSSYDSFFLITKHSCVSFFIIPKINLNKNKSKT